MKREIDIRASGFQDSVERSRAQSELVDDHLHEMPAGFIDPAVIFNQTRSHQRIAMNARRLLESCRLNLPLYQSAAFSVGTNTPCFPSAFQLFRE